MLCTVQYVIEACTLSPFSTPANLGQFLLLLLLLLVLSLLLWGELPTQFDIAAPFVVFQFHTLPIPAWLMSRKTIWPVPYTPPTCSCCVRWLNRPCCVLCCATPTNWAPTMPVTQRLPRLLSRYSTSLFLEAKTSSLGKIHYAPSPSLSRTNSVHCIDTKLFLDWWKWKSLFSKAMFTRGARARLSLGTNVNTPLFQRPTPEFGHGVRGAWVQGRVLVLRH